MEILTNEFGNLLLSKSNELLDKPKEYIINTYSLGKVLYDENGKYKRLNRVNLNKKLKKDFNIEHTDINEIYEIAFKNNKSEKNLTKPKSYLTPYESQSVLVQYFNDEDKILIKLDSWFPPDLRYIRFNSKLLPSTNISYNDISERNFRTLNILGKCLLINNDSIYELSNVVIDYDNKIITSSMCNYTEIK